MQEYLKKLYKDSKDNYYNELDKILKNKEKRFIITVNSETLMKSENDRELENILKGNYSFVPDGIAVVKAAKKLDINISERITGIDIANELIELGDSLKKKIYFFGAKPEVIKSLNNVISEKYPNLKIVGSKDGYVKDKDKVFDEVAELEPDIILVAMGIPLQEKLIYKHLNKFKKGIFVGVGGSFDVISGYKKRAPKIFIKLNLEWLYRILKEPSRIKRFYDSNVKFLFKVRKLK